MPRKPRVSHPLRDIRHALNMTLQVFAKFVGCSAIAIQRIENRSMKKMSREMADRILEATGANPFELLAGRKAVDVKGQPYSKQSFDEYQSWLQTNLYDRQFYHGHLARYLELLLIASERAGQLKLHCVNAALQHSFARIGEDFGLKNNIHGHLIEQGKIRKRVYLVRDLRKFPDYARIIGFQDNKRFKPHTRVSFDIPDGWLPEFDTLEERPILPKAIARKYAEKDYRLEANRPTPDAPEYQAAAEALSKALYWRITKYAPSLSGH